MRRNCFILLILLAGLAICVHLLSFDKTVSAEQGVETVKKIPLRIGDWQGRDFPLDSLVYDILETKSILHRSYRNRLGQDVFLSLVYYQETKVDFHAPEGCMGGQGVKTKKTPAKIKIVSESGEKSTLEVNKLIQKQDNSTTLVYYFYKTGSFVGRNYIKLRLNLILNKFKGARKSGSLIRVSAPLTINDNGKKSHDELESFVNELYPYLVKYL